MYIYEMNTTYTIIISVYSIFKYTVALTRPIRHELRDSLRTLGWIFNDIHAIY